MWDSEGQDNQLESWAIDGDSPVSEIQHCPRGILSTLGDGKLRQEVGVTTLQG